jgi:uncharacterized damage-inducible protein DinB
MLSNRGKTRSFGRLVRRLSATTDRCRRQSIHRKSTSLKPSFNQSLSMTEQTQFLTEELQNEAAATRRMFERIPFEKSDFSPHEKSTKMGQLAGHVAELFGWIPMVLGSSELDFASGQYVPFIPKDKAELLQYFDDAIAKANEALQHASPEQMKEPWTMCSGSHVIVTLPKSQVLRRIVFNHLIHHRGQLSVYLRLNNEPVPGMYGPSADEH